MEIRRHLSQHEAVEDLPLVTDSATVSRVEAMDRDRSEEALEAMATTLEWHGEDEWTDHVDVENGRVDWGTLESLLDGCDDAELADRLRALHDRYERAFPSLLRIGFETEEEFAFLPGQYVTVRFEEVSRPYSLASSPNREETEVCIRRVPGGRLTSELFTDCATGDELTVRGPNGDLLLADPSDTDMVFLATGTGVAPFKSMIDYAFEEGFDEFEGGRRDVWLFLGAAWEDDLPYHEEFRALAAERANFHYVPTVSREEYLTNWEGETAYVQQILLKYMDEDALDGIRLGPEMRRYAGKRPKCDVDARLDPARMDVYACGINAMVNSLVDATTRIGVPERRIESEGFG